MLKSNITGFWKWFLIFCSGIIFMIIWYFMLTVGVSSYYKKKGNGLYYSKQYNDAIDAYKMSIKFNKNDVRAYDMLGFTHFLIDNNQKAMEAYIQALGVNPNDVKVNVNMGILFLKQKAYIKALVSYEKVAEVSPSYPNVYNTIGLIYYKIGNYQKARESFLKYIKDNPNENYVGYINIFELDLINYQPFDKKLERTFLKNFSEVKRGYIAYCMIKNLKLIAKGKQDNMNSWDKKYQDFFFGSWDFEEIDKWIVSFENEEIKQKLIEALIVIREHVE